MTPRPWRRLRPKLKPSSRRSNSRREGGTAVEAQAATTGTAETTDETAATGAIGEETIVGETREGIDLEETEGRVLTSLTDQRAL